MTTMKITDLPLDNALDASTMNKLRGGFFTRVKLGPPGSNIKIIDRDFTAKEMEGIRGFTALTPEDGWTSYPRDRRSGFLLEMR